LADASAAAVYAAKTNTADLSGGVFTVLNSATWTKITKSIAIQQILSESGKH